MCGWAIDPLMWFTIRDKILKDRYAGCAYSALFSDSPVIIRHRSKLTGKEMKKIAKLFPKQVRVEFQEVDWEGESTNLFERILFYEFLLKAANEFVAEYHEVDGKWEKVRMPHFKDEH